MKLFATIEREVKTKILKEKSSFSNYNKRAYITSDG
jgi:hypothetical protein